MKVRFLLASVPFLFAVAGARSQQAVPEVPERLDLRGAITFALENNFAIRQARERIREQEGLIVEVKAQALPNASLDSSYTRTDDELRQEGSNGSNENWSIALNVRQILYSGGGVSAALDLQRLVREAALLDLQAVVNNALLDVRTRFYDVLLAREQIDVQEQNVNLLREQLQTARNRFEAGSVSNFDVLRAEVAVANAQAPLIRARNQYRIAIDVLRQTLGFINPSLDNVTKVPEFVGTLDFTPIPYDLQASIRTALSSRPELQSLSKFEEAFEVGVDLQKSGYRPDLAVVGGYQFRKAGNSDRFSDSVDGWTVGLQSSWAVFDGRATRGRVAQARSQLEQARLTTAEQTLAVEVEVRRAISSLQEGAELAEAAQKVVEQAEEALRLADARYAAGSATQLDVLETRVALTEARTNQIEANYRYNVALATLRRAVGDVEALLAP
jgi:outer membrane protein TolC